METTPAKQIQITCSGYEIAADWYQGANTSKVLLVLHGFRSSKAIQETYTQALVQGSGTSALVIDFSGHGESPFRLRETRPAQHFLELIYVFDWLTERYPEAEISVSGHSYGGFLAAQLTAYRPFANLILRAPAINRPEAFYNPWSIRIADPESYEQAMHAYRRDREALAKHPMLTQSAKFEGRTLVVVHGDDDIVPTEVTDAYRNAFGADEFIAEGLPHSFDVDQPEMDVVNKYHSHITKWLLGG